jgi:hypothetical protein
MTYEKHNARMIELTDDANDAWASYEAHEIDETTLAIWLECADKHFDRP